MKRLKRWRVYFGTQSMGHAYGATASAALAWWRTNEGLEKDPGVWCEEMFRVVLDG